MSYFDWLVFGIAPDYRQRDHYAKLLLALYSTEFYWVITRDRNRAEDGLDLRNQYERETGLYCDAYGPCTVLEMLIALAIRCENELMYRYNPDEGDQTEKWFWMMVDNLGLCEFDDYHHWEVEEIDDILARFMDRNYGQRFEFCPFPVKNVPIGFEKMELIYQMNYYVKEKFY